jgi:hypothetical protein
MGSLDIHSLFGGMMLAMNPISTNKTLIPAFFALIKASLAASRSEGTPSVMMRIMRVESLRTCLLKPSCAFKTALSMNVRPEGDASILCFLDRSNSVLFPVNCCTSSALVENSIMLACMDF